MQQILTMSSESPSFFRETLAEIGGFAGVAGSPGVLGVFDG